MQRLTEHKRTAWPRVNGRQRRCTNGIRVRARFEKFEYAFLTDDYLLFHAEMTHYRLLNQPTFN